RNACNRKMYDKRKDVSYKTGKVLRQARELRDAARRSGIKFGDLYELVMRKHRRIAHEFGVDRGIQLMRIDAEIALNVMYHFAGQCIPILGCHDSFIVAERHEGELREVMQREYSVRTGYLPALSE